MKPIPHPLHLVFILAGVLLLAACNKERIRGSGPVTTESRSVQNFNGIRMSGSSNVHVTKGNSFSVQVKGYSNLLPYFETNVNGTTLELQYRDNVNVTNSNIEVFVTLPELEKLHSSGSATTDVKGNFISDVLDVSISGSGNFSFDGGSANQFTQSISGSGSIRAFGLQAGKADISVSGSGLSEVQVTSRLHVDISGSGKVYYKGTPQITSNISGSGQLIHKD